MGNVKRSATFINILFLALILFQGTGLVAHCPVPCCNLMGIEKVHCVVDSMLAHGGTQSSDCGSSIRSSANACGHLEWRDLSALKGEKVKLVRNMISPAILAIFIRSIAFKSFSLQVIFTRAGPPVIGSSQALPAIPPQNAPPFLA
jgi:hypothetical protein